MAAAAKELRYQSRYVVDGSSARELEWEVRESELRHAGEAPRYWEAERERAKAKPKVRTAEKIAVRERQRVSPVSVAGVGAVVAMAIMVLVSCIQLTVLSAETVALKNQLSALETENIRLTAQYEQMFDLATVKEMAEAAGMSKPSASQVSYLNLSGGDRAIVYAQEETNVLSTALVSVQEGAAALVEYFS